MRQTITGTVTLPVSVDLETGEVFQPQQAGPGNQWNPVPAHYAAGGLAREIQLREQLDSRLEGVYEALNQDEFLVHEDEVER